MSRLDIKAKLQYPPGPWGMDKPVKGATVKIIDKDIGGGDDVILTRATNALGKFAGKSKEWQDTKQVKYWVPLPFPGRWQTKRIPDPTDILLLEIDIEDGEQHGRLPFVPLGNNIEVPIVVPWIPPDTLTATIKVNGVACDDGFDLQKKARAAFESGTPTVKIEIRGPESLPFQPFAGKNLMELKELVDDIMPGSKEMFYINPTGAEELMAIAFIILAMGAAMSVTILSSAVAFCLILALVLGYTDVKLDVISSTGSNPLPGIVFEVSK
ncbi:MAG: hypothetical protein H6645_04345 [Caldilineaceae bacterium]|nr:hypothetical protein [Caldilineaceae bacterium]